MWNISSPRRLSVIVRSYMTNKKWAASWQNGMCTQRRLRSAWASAVWSESSLSAWRKLGSLATHWANSKVFAGRTVIMLVLSWGGSNKTLLFTSDHLSLRMTKPTKWPMRPIWSESSLYAKWVANCKDPLLLHVDNEDFDQYMSFCWFCRVQAHLCWWHFKEPWLIIFKAEKYFKIWNCSPDHEACLYNYIVQ